MTPDTRRRPPPTSGRTGPQTRLEERLATLEVELTAIKEYQENSEVYQQTVSCSFGWAEERRLVSALFVLAVATYVLQFHVARETRIPPRW